MWDTTSRLHASVLLGRGTVQVIGSFGKESMETEPDFKLSLTSHISPADVHLGYAMTGTLERGHYGASLLQLTHFAVLRKFDWIVIAPPVFIFWPSSFSLRYISLSFFFFFESEFFFCCVTWFLLFCVSAGCLCCANNTSRPNLKFCPLRSIHIFRRVMCTFWL